ncbi:MAG: 4Fe-4S dicluster domain-containing protein, partial [Pseudomonadota bacterium]
NAGRARDEVSSYDNAWRSSAIGKDLWRVRNAKPLWSRFGTMIGIILGGIDMWCNTLGFSLFGTMKHRMADHEGLMPIQDAPKIDYPKPDGALTFDRLSSVFVSNTNHEEDQPSHLLLTDPSIPVAHNLPKYGEPARLYCPAGVYEIVYTNEEAKTDPRFVINAQNCVHCKTCDIKDPAQNITWVTPEGGGGPNYQGM